MNITTNLDGEQVTIINVTGDESSESIVYIDSSNNIKVKNVPLDWSRKLTIATSAQSNSPTILPTKTVACIGNSLSRFASGLATAGSKPVWGPAAAKSVTSACSPNVHDMSYGYVHRYMECVQSGTTGDLEPVWPAIGERVLDGTVIWEAKYNTTLTPSRNSGAWWWGNMLAGWPVETTYQVGVGGAFSDYLLRMTEQCEQYAQIEPDIYAFMGIFENDYLNANPAGSPLTTLQQIQDRWYLWVEKWDSLRSRGKTLILQTPLPCKIDNTSGYVRGDGSKAFEWLLRKYREYAAARADVLLVDVSDVYIDPNPANPVWPDQTTLYLQNNNATSIMATDGVHPGFAGHIKMAKVYATSLNSRWPRRNFSTTAGGVDQIAPNPAMYGTSGTFGTSATGIVADSMRTTTVLASAFCSKATESGKPLQRIVCSSSATGTVTFKPISTIPPRDNVSIGGYVELWIDMIVRANPTGWSKHSAFIAFSGSTGVASVQSEAVSTTAHELGQLVTEDMRIIVRTLGIPVPPGTTAMTPAVDLNVHGLSSNATIDVLSFAVVNPHTQNSLV